MASKETKNISAICISSDSRARNLGIGVSRISLDDTHMFEGKAGNFIVGFPEISTNITDCSVDFENPPILEDGKNRPSVIELWVEKEVVERGKVVTKPARILRTISADAGRPIKTITDEYYIRNRKGKEILSRKAVSVFDPLGSQLVSRAIHEETRFDNQTGKFMASLREEFTSAKKLSRVSSNAYNPQDNLFVSETFIFDPQSQQLTTNERSICANSGDAICCRVKRYDTRTGKLVHYKKVENDINSRRKTTDEFFFDRQTGEQKSYTKYVTDKGKTLVSGGVSFDGSSGGAGVFKIEHYDPKTGKPFWSKEGSFDLKATDLPSFLETDVDPKTGNVISRSRRWQDENRHIEEIAEDYDSETGIRVSRRVVLSPTRVVIS